MDSTPSTIERPAKPEKMPVLVDSIPAEIRVLPRWFNWAWTWNAKSSKWDKPPLKPNGRNAKSNDQKTWTTFEAAFAATTTHDGVGFSLHSSEYVGIDLDDCRDPATGEIHEPAASIIRRLDSYAEISPSRTGIKLLVKAQLPDKCRKVNHDTGVEVYNAQYFTITGHRGDGTPATINERQAEVEWLLETWVKPQPKTGGNLDGVAVAGGDDIGLARCALTSLRGTRADGYDDWLRVGMALKSVSDSLLSDWDSWSRQSSKYAEGACAAKWRTFNGHGVGLGTLLHWAKEDGWRPPKASAPTSVKDAIAGLDKGPMQHVVTNGVKIKEEQEDGTVKEKTIALSMRQIIERTDKQTCNGIRRVDGALFVDDPTHGIGWLDKTQNFIGWLARTVGKVTWHQGSSMVQQGQLFAEYQRTAPRYVSVESLPHEPPMAGHYYACQEIKPGDGKSLQWLLHRFNPATAIDGDLILSAMMTPLWGGPPGCRPCFVVTSDDGRGAGKSTLAELVGAVFDGVLQFSHLEDVATIKTRLLSPEALTRRVALIDNIKSHKFSWGELEGMITASTIGGRRLYIGEATRPNSLTWFLTLNGAALSCDMAQRSIIIKVSKPARSATWFEETSNFIRENQRGILGDLIAALRGPATPLHEFTRWATWERDVLQRLPEPGDAQKVILERQQAVDVDQEESSLVEDYFADQLRGLGYDVDAERVFVPSQVSARWYGWATNQPNIPVIPASRQLNQMATERRLHRLGISSGRTYGRGFVWTGENWAGMHTAVDLQERIRDRQRRTDKDG